MKRIISFLLVFLLIASVARAGTTVSGSDMPIGTSTQTAGNLMVSDGSLWNSVAASGDCTVSSAGAWTCLKTNNVSFGTLATLNAAPAGTLTGATLAANVLATSITSTGTLTTAVWNASKIGLLYGGTNVDLTGTGGASQVLKQTSVGGNITVARLACSDLSNAAASCSTDTTVATNITSGTLPAAQLPNPSASTLGGIQSFAAQSNKWINAISTSGVPAATQPAASDLSNGTTGSGGGVVLATGPTMTNPVVGTQAASDNSTKAASTAYTTGAISTAVAASNPAVAVNAATTTAANTSGCTYANGVAGIGATLTCEVNTVKVIDGYTFNAIGQRLLVKNDTQSPSGAFNGIYGLTALHTAGTGDLYTRSLDFDQSSDMNNTGTIPVVSGTVNGGSSWVMTSTVTTVGTDPATFTEFTYPISTLITSSTSAGGDLTGTYPNPTIAGHAVTSADLRQGVARSIIGVTGNSTADEADIQGTTNQVLRINSAGTGLAFGAIDLSQSAAATGVIQAGSFPAMTGDVTSSAGALSTTIANNAVTNAKAAQMTAHTYKGNNTGSTANAADITATQLTADLNLFTSTLQGLVPASSGGTTTFLRADGTFATPAGAGNVSTSGSPANGNLTKFTGSTTISNGDLSGDCTTSGTLAIICTKTNSVSFATSATTDTTSATNITTGVLPDAQESNAAQFVVTNCFLLNLGAL